MSDSLSKLTAYVQPPIYSWVSTFNRILDSADLGQTAVGICGMQYLGMKTFSEKLQFFKNIKIDSACCKTYGICGETFEKDIVLNDDGSVAASRFRFQHMPCAVSDDFTNAFVKTRQVVDYFSNQLPGAGDDKKAYAYSLFYVYFEQYTYIRGVAIENLLLAVGVVYACVVVISFYF
jgi:Niemann-Pick C1 protein